MPGDTVRVLRCLVKGTTIPMKVSPSVDDDVDDLKAMVHERGKNRILRDTDIQDLFVWKLKNQESLIPEESLGDRVFSQGPLSTIAVKLESSARIGDIFKDQPKLGLHIVVQFVRSPTISPSSSLTSNISAHASSNGEHPPADEPPTKRQRQSEVIVEKNVIAFWRQLWIDGENLIRQETIQRDSDCLEDVDVPGTFDVLRGLPVSFTKGGILIRSEYKFAEEGIESHRPHANAVVIVGHPGIGKSSFLLYLLARRLLARKPTIFQRDARSIYFFSATGVRRLSGDIDDESVKSSETWVLIDAKAKQVVYETPPIFTIDRSDLFLVIASSPRPSHWRDVQHYRPPVRIWLMEPFGLEELIQARQLQQTRCSETSIRQFLQEYGPSARDCYAYCESIPFYYAHHIHDRVKNIAWDTITDMLRARKDVIGMDDGSHKLILVRPSPTDRSSPSMSIITKTVARLLHERDSDARWQNARKLYRTLRANPQSKSTAGKLLEPPFHALCMKGTSFRLSSMDVKPGGRIRDIFTNDSAKYHSTLTLPPQQRIVFDREHPIIKLLANHYYQPTHGTQPSYDSFVFNPEEAIFTLFQVTCGFTHPVRLKGINALIDVAAQLGVNNPTLHFVAVVPEGDRVEFSVPECDGVEFSVFKDKRLPLQMFFIEVTENELYD